MTTTTSTLNGYFKDRYGQFTKAVPEDGNSVLAGMMPFAEAEKIGNEYVEDVRLTRAMGWTFAGGSLAGTAYALNAGRSGQTRPAKVTGNSFVLREQIAYDVISRAQNSQQAFGKAFDDLVRDMTESSILAREISLLYGSDDIGEIESVSGSSTTRDWTLTKASSSAGVWWQFANAAVDVYTAAGGSQRNSNAVVEVTGVDLDSQGRIVVSVSGNASDLGDCVAGDVLIPRGADGEWMTGLAAVSKTNSGTLYNINVATYPLWQATSHDAGTAAATVATLMQALKANRLKSGGGKRVALCSTATWTDLNNNTTVLQRFMNSRQKAGVEYGTEKISVENASISLEIKEHPLLKEGEAYVIDPRKWKRIGSRDHSWGIGAPGQGERFFRELDGNAGFELRCYWDQAAFCRLPGSVTRIHSIVNSV